MAFSFAVVTIGDVAKAHVLAAEKKQANGRYHIDNSIINHHY